ncbi:hypothetical protein GCM10010406_06430 [Streptomyces thermolineatus]|uniref:Uncharacterized protein n=1 Tax=Streptomyces thermolineatus TaxID=44033 RepID=A0ABP5Y517_9ACTN
MSTSGTVRFPSRSRLRRTYPGTARHARRGRRIAPARPCRRSPGSAPSGPGTTGRDDRPRRGAGRGNRPRPGGTGGKETGAFGPPRGTGNFYGSAEEEQL